MAAAVPIDATSISPTTPREVDDVLVARALAGDESASSRSPRRESAKRSTRGAQETFLAALRGLPRYQGRSCFGTWLLGITYHLICRAQRRRTRRTLLECTPGLAETLA